MKYRIVGADGKVYGPIELDQLRQWLAEGRADNRTPVYVEGAANWTYLGLLPELSAAFAHPPAIAAPQTLTTPAGTNGFAVTGLVCAVLAWLCCCCGWPLDLLALVFCIIALTQIGAQAQPQEGKTLAIIGLVLAGLHFLFSLGGLIMQMAFGATNINWASQFQ